MRPSALVIEIDSLKDETSYFPTRVKGSQISLSRMNSTELDAVVSAFFAQPLGEKKSEFARLLSRLLAFPDSVKAQLITEGNSFLGLILFDYRNTSIMKIPITSPSPPSARPTHAKMIRICIPIA